jgi:hypothetical protein
MRRQFLPLLFAPILVVAAVCSSPLASAAAQRTFVASFGSPSNTAYNCALANPCRAFSEALGVTNAGGEVIVLDSAGYGAVTIAQSVSIVAPAGVYAGISAFSGAGVTIDGAGIDVKLRGLTINGQGASFGIHMANGAQLDLDGVTISNFPGVTGTGLLVQTAGLVNVANTTIVNVTNGMQFGYSATATVVRSRLAEIAAEGIEIVGGGPASGTTVNVTDTTVACVRSGVVPAFGKGIHNYPSSGGALGRMYLSRISVSNCWAGVVNEAQTSFHGYISLGDSLVSGNAYGLWNATDSGPFLTTGNNQVVGISGDVVGTITPGGVQ